VSMSRQALVLVSLSPLTILTALVSPGPLGTGMSVRDVLVRAEAAHSPDPLRGNFAALSAQGTVGTPITSVTPATTGTTTIPTVSTATPTQSYDLVAVPTVIVKEGVYRPAGEGSFPYADPAFERLWTSIDGPVGTGTGAPGPWAWGPGPNTRALLEPYREDPTGLGQRLVQYFDKSRMELNDPLGDPDAPFYVSNGLLTVELVSGLVQQGQDSFAPFRLACIPVVGDQGDKLAPTYAAMGKLANTRIGDHPSPDRTGTRVIETVDRAGNVGSNAHLGDYEGVELVHYEPSTHHNIPRIFWDFLNAPRSSTADGKSHSLTNDAHPRSEVFPIPPTTLPSLPWYFASGLPISEPYWARADIAGRERDVMIQLYERRALTYVPENVAEWQVEMANIGQHYFDWRYRNLGVCRGQEGAVGTPTPPRFAPTPTSPTSPTSPTAVAGSGPRAVVDIVAYVDTNGNDNADPGEGLTGMRVVLIHRQTNSPERRAQTDRNGHAHLEWQWDGAVNISLPDIGWIDTVEAGEVESKNAYRGQSGAWTSEDDGSLLLKVHVKPIALPAVIP
jgi:hypothetical protein